MFTVLKVLIVIAISAVVLIFVARLVFALPEDRGNKTVALDAATEGPLAGALIARLARHPDMTGVAPLADGADAFAARVLLADAAVSSIDAQYYIWQDDLTGLLLFDALRQAADRGVRVRLLLDDHGTSGVDGLLAGLNAHPMVDVRLYNPFNLRRFKMLSYGFDFFRLNRRMHNKSFTVDGLVTVMGGRNVGDEYFGTGEAPLYVDLDVLAVGQIVPEAVADFDRYWNAPSVHPAGPIVGTIPQGDPIPSDVAAYRGTEQMEAYRERVETSKLVGRLANGTLDLEWTNVILVSDDPAKGEGEVPRDRLLAAQLTRAVGEIRERFDGISPYFVPGTRGTEQFAALAANGVQVRMLTNSLAATDVLPVHAGYAKRRRDLLKSGVELFELKRQVGEGFDRGDIGLFGSSGASLHAKTFAVDGRRIYVGSFNFDPRSVHLNTEMGLLIDSESMAQSMHDGFNGGLGGLAWQVELTDGNLLWADPEMPEAAPLTKEPGTSLPRRIALAVIGWLPVEWLL